MKTRFRIVHSRGYYTPYMVESRAWWWPFWMYVTLCDSIEGAEAVIAKLQNPVIKEF
jgi:hypothetical protein